MKQANLSFHMLIAVGHCCEIEPKAADNTLVHCSWSSRSEQASMVSELSNINTSDLLVARVVESSTLCSCCQESNVGIRFTVKGERKKRREGKRENWVIAIKVVYVRCVT